MDWSSATASLLVPGTLCAALQLWGIRSLVRRNRRRRGAEPLRQQDFRQELERIFRKTT